MANEFAMPADVDTHDVISTVPGSIDPTPEEVGFDSPDTVLPAEHAVRVPGTEDPLPPDVI